MQYLEKLEMGKFLNGIGFKSVHKGLKIDEGVFKSFFVTLILPAQITVGFALSDFYFVLQLIYCILELPFD